MKLKWWHKILAWLLEQAAPRLIAKALEKIKVEAIIEAIKPFVRRIVEKIPSGYHANLKQLLSLAGEFFTSLAEEI